MDKNYWQWYSSGTPRLAILWMKIWDCAHVTHSHSVIVILPEQLISFMEEEGLKNGATVTNLSTG